MRVAARPPLAILVTSVIFALGHVATLPYAARLAVFFPSLLFGLLRARTGGIGACDPVPRPLQHMERAAGRGLRAVLEVAPQTAPTLQIVGRGRSPYESTAPSTFLALERRHRLGSNFYRLRNACCDRFPPSAMSTYEPSFDLSLLPTFILDALVNRALDEDLGGGDVTTDACIDASAQGDGERRGPLARSWSAAGRSSPTCSAPSTRRSWSSRSWPTVSASPRRPRCGQVRGPSRALLKGGAGRVELHSADDRDRHHHAALRRRAPRGRDHAHHRHPEDDARPARARSLRGARLGAGRTTATISARRCSSRTTTWRRAAGCGRPSSARASTRRTRRVSSARWTRWSSSTRRSMRARTSCCSTTWTMSRSPRRSAACARTRPRGAVACSPRPPAGSPWLG